VLHEIGHVRQDLPRGTRRWFQDAYFDLYVWHDAQGSLIAFQLCHDRLHAEGTISWSSEAGYAHASVDQGRTVAAQPSTPILRAGPPPPYFRVYQRFLDATKDWGEQGLREVVLGHLREYRRQLYGRRRPTRRPQRVRQSRRPPSRR